MTSNPPPGPDWILGEDGHWKPPPFQVGFGTGPTPPPAGPAGRGAPSQPGPQGQPGPHLQPGQPQWGPQGAWPGPSGPPQWGAQGPLPPAPRSSSSSLGLILGLGGAAVVGIVVVCVLAVTFLGTSAPKEGRMERVAAGDGPTGDLDGGSSGGASGSTLPEEGADAEGMPLSEIAARAMANRLQSGGWVVVAAEPVPLQEGAGACHPEGWHDGATDRFRVGFHADGVGEAEVRTIAYETDAHAQADLERARSAEHQECLRQAASEYAGAPVDVQVLPADPTVPGVTYRSTSNGPRGPLVQDDTYIVVGRVRAYVSYCTCRAMDEAARHTIAQQIAIGMAQAQGMPDPG